MLSRSDDPDFLTAATSSWMAAAPSKANCGGAVPLLAFSHGSVNAVIVLANGPSGRAEAATAAALAITTPLAALPAGWVYRLVASAPVMYSGMPAPWNCFV